MPPESSKNRSRMMRSSVGSAPRLARPAARYCTTSAATSLSTPQRCSTYVTASSALPCCSSASTPLRSADTSSESSRVRAGASPSQKGTDGGAPNASTTRTVPLVTRVIRHEVLPSKKMSPAIDSIAQSSLTVPMNVSSGSASTR